MHEIEPFYGWRDHYVANDDKRSPFYGQENNEFQFTNACYNYLIHPQWDDFGSNSLYAKHLFCQYDLQFAVLELIGEWNDCLHNDVMMLKDDVINPLMKQGISKFLIIGENVLNFHSSDVCYYEEWGEECRDRGGWILATGFREHVLFEMKDAGIDEFMWSDRLRPDFNWRAQEPAELYEVLSSAVSPPQLSTGAIPISAESISSMATQR